MSEEFFLSLISYVSNILFLMSENSVFFISMSAIIGLCFVTWCLSGRRD